MKRLLTLLLLATGLAGCQTAAQQQFEAAKKQCRSGKGTNVEKTRCVLDADAQISGTFRYPDLQQLRNAIVLDLAAKQDRGELTKEQADVQSAIAQAQIVSEIERRDSGRAARWAAMRGASPQPTQPSQPVMCNTTTPPGFPVQSWTCQ